jgi:hypothetical protein
MSEQNKKISDEAIKIKHKEESRVTTIHDNELYWLVFCETIVSISKNDDIVIDLGAAANNWIFTVRFTENIDDTKAMVTPFVDGNNLIVECRNWYSDTWVENITGLPFKSTDESFRLMFKIRSTANRHDNHRSSSITIWRAELKP